MKLLDILKEAKQAGVLYYFGSFTDFTQMMKSGIAFKGKEDRYWIIVSREGSIYSGARKQFMLNRMDLRIALDGNMVSQNYSISPINTDNVIDMTGKSMLAYRKFKADAMNRFERIAKNNPSIKEKVKSEQDILKYYGDRDIYDYKGYSPKFDTKEGGTAQEIIRSTKPGYLEPKYFLRVDIKVPTNPDKYYKESVMKLIDKARSENPSMNIGIVPDFK